MISRLRSGEAGIAVGVVVLALIAFLVWPSSPDGSDEVEIEPGEGVAWSVPEETPEATPEPTPEPTPAPTPEPAPATAGDGTTQLQLCRQISGQQCQGQVNQITPNMSTMTALVHLRPARAGETVAATLSGPGGTIPGGSFTFSSGGNGYFYSTFSVGGLPPGNYTVIITRNGAEAARVSVPKPN
jgi:hypothetical protein